MYDRDWKQRCFALWAGFALAWGLLADPASAQDTNTNTWQVERLRLKNGNVVEGLILTSDGETIEMLELRRPPSRPMFLVVRPIARFEVSKIERLDDEQRQSLETKIQKFRKRALVEQGQIDAVTLAAIDVGKKPIWRYQGDWFRFDSDLDPQTTRLCIVRLEQMFLAYRQILPVRHLPRIDNWLEIRAYGSTQAYYEALNTLGIEIRNLACYDPADNLVVAGSDAQKFSLELAQSRREHEKILGQYDQWNAGLPGRLKQLEQSLEENGVARAERGRIVAAARKQWDKEQTELRNRIRLLDRKNESLRSGLVDDMLRSLYHEAFHAYLEDYVFRRSLADVPNWLNEGLAQIFEAGLLDAGTLRIDAPVATKLKKLQRDLKSEQPLALAELLTTDGQAFLVHRAGPVDEAQRRYLYSWGLAYYLTFDRGLFDTEKLDRYVLHANASPGNDPIKRFEQLVGEPLGEFEKQWREFILAL